MGKRRRGHPDIEEVLSRPWCYYCERDFEDLKLLISHQKAKHFKCDRCGRRLNTAGGLSVHMNQVHKESLTQVENALPNRQGLEVEIFGMEGIPQDILDQHRNRIIQNFYQAQEDRRIATGNPIPGQAMKRKKITYESPEELAKRLAEFRAHKQAVASGAVEGVTPTNPSPVPYNQGYPKPPAAQPTFPYAPGSLPARPGSTPSVPASLPQRPGGAPVDSAAPTDDIDQMIRMAEAGIKPAKKPEEADEATEKKTKKEKDKKGRLVYEDAEVSPEERMAALPRYAFNRVAVA
ncbi:hypothetical protein B0I35DRAFT_277365 [Stachybotrys elegans]|uniref:C2H2-type domain-containing protein n=1 Tax=Stachybotrys elegans TaxID=80388 RepID=A0A8K0SJ55_9HYPO|nr:hypothetical protein B0I35DRAFT_277365 [Stachybotrys elegans]